MNESLVYNGPSKVLKGTILQGKLSRSINISLTKGVGICLDPKYGITIGTLKYWNNIGTSTLTGVQVRLGNRLVEVLLDTKLLSIN